MANEGRRTIGTVEGVALILSILACLTLFLKIMPNLNSNAEFYNEQFIAMQKQLDQLQVKTTNLDRIYGKPQYREEIRGFERILTEIEFAKQGLPDSYQGQLKQLREQVTQLIEMMKNAKE